jgi:hypothetical protein
VLVVLTFVNVHGTDEAAYLDVLMGESRSPLLRFLVIVGDVGISAIEGILYFCPQAAAKSQGRLFCLLGTGRSVILEAAKRAAERGWFK